jgi:hypothetical protein
MLLQMTHFTTVVLLSEKAIMDILVSHQPMLMVFMNMLAEEVTTMLSTGVHSMQEKGYQVHLRLILSVITITGQTQGL